MSNWARVLRSQHLTFYNQQNSKYDLLSNLDPMFAAVLLSYRSRRPKRKLTFCRIEWNSLDSDWPKENALAHKGETPPVGQQRSSGRSHWITL